MPGNYGFAATACMTTSNLQDDDDMTPTAMNEFNRPIVLRQVGDRESRHLIVAEPDEREALAKRLGLANLTRLEGEVALRRVRGGTVLSVRGQLRAELAQYCVVTLEPLPVQFDEAYAESFALAGKDEEPDPKEVDIWLDEELETPGPELLSSGSFDLGEFLVQLLAERLDAFPRKPDAPSPEGEWGPADDEETTSPFAELGRKLGGR